MLDLKRTKIELKIDGNVLGLTRPSVSQFEQYQKDYTGVEESEQLNVMRSFFETLGMPKAIFDSLEIEHLQLIVEAISGQKKS